MNDFINIYLNNNTLQLAKSNSNDNIDSILASINLLKSNENKSINHKVTNPLETLQHLYSFFPHIVACGGVIKNELDEVLFIFRRAKWDLPKGKLDKGETTKDCAIREVQEETGLRNLLLHDFICNCYHIYFDKWQEQYVLKETFWYAMTAASTEKLVPQTEEDIEDIEWVKLENFSMLKSNTFNSIIEVLENYSIFNSKK